MRTYNNLYPLIYEFSNIHMAYYRARRGKRYKKETLSFEYNLEENLFNIHNELVNETYIPSRYREFYVTEPKKRLILCLPLKDRVIHQAICHIIAPIFEWTFIHDTYACRIGKGALAGVNRLYYFLQKELSKSDNLYCLKMDIRKYFYSIDHQVIKNLIRKKIRCTRTLKLLDIIIDSTDNPGIAIGNLTSQLFANIYLGALDHYIKEELQVKSYVRYMDDMVILHHDKAYLWELYRLIKNFTESNLKLNFNNKTSVFNVSRGIDFLGYRQFKDVRILRKRVMIKNIRKFKKFIASGAPADKINMSLASLKGLTKHCSAKRFDNKIKDIICLNS